GYNKSLFLPDSLASGLFVVTGGEEVTARSIIGTDLGISTISQDWVPIINNNALTAGYRVLSGSSIGNTVVLRNASGTINVSNATVDSHAITLGQANSLYQPLDADLTSIAALSTNGFAKRT